MFAAIAFGLLCLAGLCHPAVAQSRIETQRTTSQPTSQPAAKKSDLLTELDAAIAKGQFAVVLRRIAEQESRGEISADLRLRAARAHLELGEALGKTQIRRIEGGEPGRFDGEWLIIEAAAEPMTFLCAPPASACNQIRRAIDGGADGPDAHRLFARIWLASKRPRNALAVLQLHERSLLDDDSDATLTLLAEANLAANDLKAYLDVMQRLARGAGEKKDQVLAQAYFAVADVYNLRGDEALHREFLRRALRLAPETESRMLELGDALWEADEKTEAREWYRKLIDRRPGHPDRLRVLQRIAE